MPLRIESVDLDGVVVLVPEVYQDERGYFLEVFRAGQLGEAGLPTAFVQENQSYSRKGVLRGLHFQWNPPMGKLMRVTRGKAFVVAVDLRLGSPTLGKWFGTEASAENRRIGLGAGQLCARVSGPFGGRGSAVPVHRGL